MGLKKISLFILAASFFTLNSQADDMIEHCHKVEGLRLPGCTPQAHPLDCGELKPCPPQTITTNCDHMNWANRTSGHCDSGHYQCPPGETTNCDFICDHSTAPSCEIQSVQCGRETMTLECVPDPNDSCHLNGDGTTTPAGCVPKCYYNCHVSKCDVQVPPGITNCGPACTNDQTCP